MDGFSTGAPKSAELVDNFLDIDETFHSYLVSLNERRRGPMQERPRQNYAEAYGQPYETEYVGEDRRYFQVTPTSGGPLNAVQTKPPPLGYEQRARQTNGASARSGTKGDLKHTQLQEKNRMAQKRFRERQKQKISELHQQISSLENRVKQLMMENTSLQSHNSLLEKVLAMRDEHIKVIQQQQFAEAEQAEVEAEGKEVKLSTETLKKMTPEDVMQLWHMYVTEISSALVEFNSQTGGSTLRIKELIDEVSKVFMRLSVINPLLCKVWQAREYHTSEREELERWQSAIGQMNFSDSQKREMVQLRRLFLDELQGLVDEKKKLHLTVQTMLVSETVAHKLAIEHLKTNQTVVRLRDILRLENNAMLQFCSTIIHKILRPEQVATMMVHAYPKKPDLLAITSAIAVNVGEDVQVARDGGSTELPAPALPDVLSTTTSKTATQITGQVDSSGAD